MAKGKYQKWLTKDGQVLLKGWARDGFTDDQIAQKMGITRSTFYEWKKKYSDISDALSQTKEIVDSEIEAALKKRAEGYETWEEEEIWSAELQEWIPYKRKKKHIAADTTATSMWLRNRCPEKWRDKPEVVVKEIYEDDGLMTALNTSLAESEDDSWLYEGGEDDG